jgi:hypothetical protein
MTPVEFDSLAGFCAAVCAAAQAALEQRARSLLLVSPGFEGWPLEEPALLEALAAFVRLPDRRVRLIASRFDGVARACPRFVAWRQVWSHRVEALTPAEDGAELPTLLLADRHLAVRVIDAQHWRGRVMVDRPAVHRLRHELDAFAQRCEPTFGASTLGL